MAAATWEESTTLRALLTSYRALPILKEAGLEGAQQFPSQVIGQLCWASSHTKSFKMDAVGFPRGGSLEKLQICSWDAAIMQSILGTILLELPSESLSHCKHFQRGWIDSFSVLWGTIPSMGNVAQPPLGKASGERGWWAGPMSMDRFFSGKSGLHCT